MAARKRVLNISVVPGQKKELVESGGAQLCIHLVVQHTNGPFHEPCILQIDKVAQALGKQALFSGPRACRLACDHKRQVAAKRKIVGDSEVVTVTLRTDDPRAVTCPNCKASEDYAKRLKIITDSGA